MGAPIIDPGQGFLGYSFGQAFDFQPGIFENGATVTAVVATGLPSGASINATTGLVSFTSAVAVGSYNIGVRATNSGGTTPNPTYFFVVIAPADSTVIAGGSDIGTDVYLDVETKEVSRTAAGSTDADATEAAKPVLIMKSGDVQLLNVRFTKGGVLIDPNPTSLKLSLKEFLSDGDLVLAGGAVTTKFVKSGSGASAVCKLPVPLTGADVVSALSNYEKARTQEFTALAELELKQTTTVADVTELVLTSRTFLVLLARDQVGA